MIFKDSEGNIVPLVDVVNHISAGYEYEIFVGTDSQVRRKKRCVTYATCIVLYKKGKGGRVFVATESQPYSNSLKERLMNEVWRSLTIAFELSNIVPKNVEIVIHVDVNGSTRYKSGSYSQELVSLITGQGYKVRIKPMAWAAQHVADYFAKR